MSEVWKEVNLRWKEMSEEEKRPYEERYETALESWRDERAKIRAQFEAMEVEDKGGNKENSQYNGFHLFSSEVQISGASSVSNYVKMWNDLSPEEKEIYNERARKIKQKGQGALLASTIKKFGRNGPPRSALLQFHNLTSTIPNSSRTALLHHHKKRPWQYLGNQDLEP